MRFKDPRLAIGLLMVVVGVSVLIVAATTYDSIDTRLNSLSETSKSSVGRFFNTGSDDEAIPPGTLLAQRCSDVVG